MILLWGLLEDDTLRSVYDRLTRWHADVVFANHAAIGRSRLRLVSDGRRDSYDFTCGDRPYRLDDVSAAYLRPYDARDYGETAGDAAGTVPRSVLVHHLMNAWAEGSRATIVNRPSAEATNHSKLHQARQIRAGGFLVPDSMVTNDPERIRAFQARHGSVIYKSMSSVRSIVKELRTADLVAPARLGPVLFQQRIVGRNIRVHVIRDQTVACAIRSDGIDYRYAPSRVEPYAIPSDVASRCVALTARLGLVLAGIDLIATDRDEWYCLEVNPNPAFSYYETSDDKTIARRLADVLLG